MKKDFRLTNKKQKRLEELAAYIRRDLIETLVEAGSGHTAGSLGLVEIFTALYFHVLVHDPKHPEWKRRDRLILSNGHCCPVRYVAMAHAGYFPKKYLMTLRKFGSFLQGHPEVTRLPSLETTSGPLGSGSSQAAGMAYAAKMDKANWRVYCIISDGELGCGQTWEAFLFAGKNQLSNCTFILDRNHIQIDGFTEDIMPLEPLEEKFKAFNLHVINCLGNNIGDVIQAINKAKDIEDKPTVIIANTIPGCGIDFMENDFLWHGKVPRPGKEAKKAIQATQISF
ncbi:transketolase [Candidatus Uhrbacteria bacterium CG_4_9_14_3_um_filter_36_7]|uniref:Transketolase n=1 Tax=Candidatus Uhrbacteria bacterium CG_4_9_14_3_um_filter_36_7 TaxID=1975033 RepID=A0A2M7XH78_9BACT|nr:MAG: transketolase [Candidatus Uhrbacteria bacterium CG_4_9_14_3_um_filter_36_7]